MSSILDGSLPIRIGTTWSCEVGDDGLLAAVHRGVAHAVQTLVGDDLDGDEVAPRGGDDDFDLADFHGVLGCGGWVQPRMRPALEELKKASWPLRSPLIGTSGWNLGVEFHARDVDRGVRGDDVEDLVAVEIGRDGKKAGFGGRADQGVRPEVLAVSGFEIVVDRRGDRPIRNDVVEPHAGDGEILIAAHEGVGLRLADPFRQAVGLFRIVRVVLVDGEVVEMRLAAEGEADGVDAGGLADPADAVLDGGAHGVVAADDVVVVDDVILEADGRGDGGHVDEGVAAFHGRDEALVIVGVGADEGEVAGRGAPAGSTRSMPTTSWPAARAWG